jgi:integrase
VKWNLAHRNVAKLIDAPRVKRKEIRPLNPDEAKKFLEVIESDRLQALYITCLSTQERSQPSHHRALRPCRSRVAHAQSPTGGRAAARRVELEADRIRLREQLRHALDGPRVTRRFQKILEDAGLPKQRFHDLRHAAASLLLAQGVNPRVVMEILGHSQISLTMNTYSHVIPSLQSDAAKLMDAMLGESR